MRFPKQCKDILVYVPLAAGFVKLMIGVWLDAAILLAVVIINGFWASFSKQLRDGQVEPIQTEAFHDRIGQARGSE